MHRQKLQKTLYLREREREREKVRGIQEKGRQDLVKFCISCLLDLYPLQGNALMEEGRESFEQKRVTEFYDKNQFHL